jgi:hypothetical protein
MSVSERLAMTPGASNTIAVRTQGQKTMALALPASVQPARKVRITSQQVAFMMLTEGANAVRSLHAKPGHEIAAATFDGAVDLLSSQPEARSALEALRGELLGDSAPGERGRPAAKVGDSRSYKVQQVGDGDPFIRLPVSLLGAVKGGSVTVSFGTGTITVRV